MTIDYDDPYWTAPLIGQDWRDEDVLRATGWLRTFVPAQAFERRLDQARETLLTARATWETGDDTTLFNSADAIAWYILQAETFAIDRRLLVPEWTVRVVPFLTRLGKELDVLRSIGGVEERAERLMTSERGQPDGGIYELLVGLAYRRHGWSTVDFVAETRGRGRTPDLHVSRPGRRWAVECKRVLPSGYARREKARGVELARPVHELSLELGRPIIVEVRFKCSLFEVPDDYLRDKVLEAGNRRLSVWSDDLSAGRVRDVDWRLARTVLAKDFIYFGSSKMIQLLTGSYQHEADHSMAAKWRPCAERPFWADAIYHASVVSWWSDSEEAVDQKSSHFRRILNDAGGQLPDDRPGVVHVGFESLPTPAVAANRHLKNMIAATGFEPENPRFRWVYANYFVPELTTRGDESWAVTETMAPYRIGRHRTEWPLPGHMLLTPEDQTEDGVFWARSLN